MVTDWNNEFLLVTQQTSSNLVSGPPEVAREIAQMGAAMSDAVNAATGGPIASFDYTGGTVANANASVAAATAAYTALANIFTDPVWSTPINQLTTNPALSANTSNTTLATNTVIPELQNFLTTQLSDTGVTPLFSSTGLVSLSCSGGSTAACNGYNLGISAAGAVNNATASSPSGAGTNPVASGATASITNGLNANVPTTGPNLQPGTSGTTPGVYVPPASRPEMFPSWGPTAPNAGATTTNAGVVPVGISSAQLSAAQNTVSGPPSITSQTYANALLQTECQGSSSGQSSLPSNILAACKPFLQTPAQQQQDATDALFWNDPGTTIQPPGHWLQIANAALQTKNSSLLQSAQLTALLGESMDDAGIAAWGEKYTYNLWRPITAIQNCSNWSTDFTTCDSTWTSLIATPPHPDYLAGHPAFSGSAATVLADFFGTDNVNFTSTSDAYCNGGTTVSSNAQVVACTLSGQTYSLCATGTVNFDNDVAVSCSDGSTFGVGCNTVTTTGTNNGSPLICPISLTFDSFTDASSGENGAEYSRVVGGIHTPFSVEDALTVGNAIGEAVAADAGLPQIVAEPSTLAICSIGLLALTRRRRRVIML